MRILLISANRNALPMPVLPIGACAVAEAAESAGHSVRLLDLMFTPDARAALQSAVDGFRPEVIGISVRNIDNIDMRNPVSFVDELQRMVQILRSRTGVPVILGGAALGVMPEAILRSVPATCAVAGEGETTFPLLLERLRKGESVSDLPGVAIIEGGDFRLNPVSLSGISMDNPSPDYPRWLNVRSYRSRMATLPIQTKRGCPFRCVYCTYPLIEGKTCRFREADSVAEEVARFAAAGHRDIEIVDSVFNAPPDHAMEICDALAQKGSTARLQCLELSPLHLDDRLLTAMERAGFVGMGITLESAADPVLNGLQKGFGAREVHHAAEAVRRHRISCAWIFLFGGPGETEETVRETLRFARSHIRPGDVAFFNTGLRIYPGTELETIARRQGLLTKSPDEMLVPAFYISPEVDAGWMEAELKTAKQSRLNFIDIDSLSLPFLPAMYRIGAKLGLRSPLWRHTRKIRRGLRLAGMDV